MRMRLVASLTLLTCLTGVTLADDYAVDAMHSSVTFKVSHLGLAWIHGRFNDVAGAFSIGRADASKSTFQLTIKAESIDTAVAKRDEHLRSPDFFNVKQFPALTFKSTAVTAIKDSFQVTGDLTLHGVTKSVRFPVVGGRTAEFPKGVQRTGYSTALSIKRTDFGMDKMVEAIGDEIHIAISIEGTKK